MEPEGQSVVEPDIRANSIHSKKKCLYTILIASGLWGFLAGILPEDSFYVPIMDIIYTIVLSLSILTWSLLDSEERHYSISTKLSILIFLIWIIGFPFYILRTHKRRTAMITLIHAALFAMVCIGFHYIFYWAGCYLYISGGIPFIDGLENRG